MSTPDTPGREVGHAPRRRPRRPVPARRFTGVGRHGKGDTAAVLSAQEHARAAAGAGPVGATEPDDADLASLPALSELLAPAAPAAPAAGSAPEDRAAGQAPTRPSAPSPTGEADGSTPAARPERSGEPARPAATAAAQSPEEQPVAQPTPAGAAAGHPGDATASGSEDDRAAHQGAADRGTEEPGAEWLVRAEDEAEAGAHADTGFADSLARHGLSLEELHAQGVPAGYLPAQDFFSGAEEVDVAARRRRRRRRTVTFLSIALVIVLALGTAGWWTLHQLTGPPPDYDGPGEGQVAFTIESGWGSKQIGRSLEEKDVVKSAKAFDVAVADADTAPVFHPGQFQLKQHMAAADALTALTSSGSSPVTYFSLPSNTRLPAALTTIADSTGLDEDELTSLANDPKQFGLPAKVKNLEGYLHPGEYRLPKDADAKKVLQTLVDATKKSLKSQGLTTQETQYRALIIGSIVAGESRPADFARVAGVIENRLKPDNKETHGLLQLDSTVSYGLGQTSVHITKEELKNSKNAYNTYVHQGLPPGPIGSPGDSAIKAAAHPQASDDYYWVTVNLSTGETKFAKTYAEHQKYVEEYRNWCSANADQCT